jgi:hypothetical protein
MPPTAFPKPCVATMLACDASGSEEEHVHRMLEKPDGEAAEGCVG